MFEVNVHNKIMAIEFLLEIVEVSSNVFFNIRTFVIVISVSR